MHDREPLQKIRDDVEAKQRATVWPDTLRNGATVDGFLWKGDAHAKPIQRPGLIVFAVTFLLVSVATFSIPFQKKFEDGSGAFLLLALAEFLLSLRLFRNAFLRPPRSKMEESVTQPNREGGHLE